MISIFSFSAMNNIFKIDNIVHFSQDFRIMKKKNNNDFKKSPNKYLVKTKGPNYELPLKKFEKCHIQVIIKISIKKIV